jgi:hypothetical protein
MDHFNGTWLKYIDAIGETPPIINEIRKSKNAGQIHQFSLLQFVYVQIYVKD